MPALTSLKAPMTERTPLPGAVSRTPPSVRASAPTSTARGLRERRSDLKVLYVSGHAEDLIATRGIVRPGIHFLAKPFTRDSLLEKVRDVLASPEPGDVGA